MKNRIVLCLGGSLLAGVSLYASEPVKMNVVYILADDLGYGDIGCYGQQKIKTPNIDRLAQEGMQFMHHYAGCTVSAPSRCSLMTGLHTGHAQIRGNKEVKPEGQQPMAEDTYTLAKLMKSAGYKTGIFGKWGLGYPGSSSTPLKMGFDEFYGYNCQRQAHSYYPDHLWHNDTRVDFEANMKEGRKIYSQDLIHEEAMKFILKNKEEPFFAMLTYTLPHAELNLPHDSIYKMYENAFEEVPYDGKMGYHPSEKPYASFAAMVTRLDKYVGDVIAELKELGLDKNTIVIFASDNGPHREGGANPDYFDSYGPFKGVKRDVYEGGIRVPMIISWPERVQPSTQTDFMCSFWDVMPTFREILNPKAKNQQMDGVSLLPLLENRKGQKEHEYLYFEFQEMNGRQAVRKGPWKLVHMNVRGKNPYYELYNLNSDPSERHNVLNQYPEKVTELKAIMQSSHIPNPNFPLLPGEK